MMYPRLKLARNLLTDDGVIFISIDDNEVNNLKKICDEVFGEKNFITLFIWEKGREGGNDSSILRSHYEFICCYCKNYDSDNIINLDPKDTSRHIFELPEQNLVFGINEEINKGELFQLINLSKQKDYLVSIPLIDGTILKWDSYAPQKTIDSWIENGKLFVGSTRVPYVKSFLKDELQGKKPSNIITQEYGTTKAGSIEIRNLFGNKKLFSYAKPSLLINRLLQIGSKKDSIVLDFFSGSGSSSDAVFKLNNQDHGNRKFILVQIPESTDEKSEAFKSGYKNICEIGKERIRRAGDKILEESDNKDLDIGFKVFKLDSSNLEKWDPDYDNIQQSLIVDNIKENRTKEDLIYELILKTGLDLTSPIEEIDNMYLISNSVLICLDDNITSDISNKILKLAEEYNILRVIFKDSGFKSDADKTNLKETLKTNKIEQFITI